MNKRFQRFLEKKHEHSYMYNNVCIANFINPNLENSKTLYMINGKIWHDMT